MTYSKKIILILFFFSIACLSFLAYAEKKQQDYNYGKSWWTAYFSQPQTDSPSFTIENHSSETSFHWEILINKDSVSSGDSTVGLGEKKSIPIQFSRNNDIKKITIKISTKKGSKEIYKTFQ